MKLISYKIIRNKLYKLLHMYIWVCAGCVCGYLVAYLNPTDHPYMVSFDVVPLFTCIPTLETIDIILDRVYNKKTRVFHNLKRDELKRLLIICTQESHFQFNGEYYDQVDGVAMGSPLGPLFANIFMSHLEKKHMGTL